MSEIREPDTLRMEPKDGSPDGEITLGIFRGRAYIELEEDDCTSFYLTSPELRRIGKQAIEIADWQDQQKGTE